MPKQTHSSLRDNTTIREAIQKIALYGVMNKKSGTLRDTEKITGYIVKINTEGDLAGTVDVQEYVDDTVTVEGQDDVTGEEGDNDTKVGYHEGVLLSALQDNSNGYVIVPKLYSDVTITIDPESQQEYVIMYSAVDMIQLDSHSTVSVGVKEREEFDETDEESPDVHELKETGVYTNTTYLKDSIHTTAQGSDSGNKVTHVLDSLQSKTVIGEDKTSMVMNKDYANIKHDKSEIIVNNSKAISKCGNSSVSVQDGKVYLGAESGVDDAVLGGQLADILSDMLGYIGQIITTTQLGPQAPINVAQFVSLQAKVKAFKASHSGFLTNKVQVQK